MTTNDVHTTAASNSDIPDDEGLRDILEVFKTMSDPTRMRIILAIAKGPITVNELAAMLDLGQSTVSHQLRILKQTRLVVGDRSGKQIYYHLVDDHVLEIYELTKAHIEEKQHGQIS
ncbi:MULTISPECIES: ArsR/SmtB family transcription factor [Lacticaseibacillus]|uniref:Transcriptional regulator n=3 Tax=Lacticaseibacillus TaxID=2759736 RepID=A0AAD1AMM0_LACCA|nr:metalloregulator ArsR/SmtB family transcription factor [Lacticaseibacillus casei]HAJ55134.1 ArsR family transcriptional regulator [Lactobacillus sp.]MBI6598025.1 winged helix-turn-helix transcriptional regulator [Lacticaseibacillus casei]MBO1481731.1 winged helix-turn-helix transcriptional regulator [Lacticaseibacillus casei]MBO2417011.1 winged helix-turn-helix transcriptional regulator [Lacticaseibacillus casei]MCK2081400.1 winged helix-turn-helix transcriptional regulator [Lacticaseibacil